MAEKKAQAKKYNLDLTKIILAPLVTEKTSLLASDNKYTFLVSAKANKPEIRKAINNLYNVDPVKINIINIKGKKVFRGGRVAGERNDVRKAVVTLKEGDKIDVLS